VSCCGRSNGCVEFFGERVARRSLRRYRKKGLPADARLMVDWAATGGLGGASVLEVGGGIGAVAADLLVRGAGTGENLELVPAWEPFATELAREQGLQTRLRFRVGDLLADPVVTEPADVVALQRVVCCNPDGVRLAGIAAGLARRVLVLSYPRDAFWTRRPVWLQNTVFRLLGRSFRAFVHDPRAILEAAQAAGLRLEHRHRGVVWEVASLRRA
jgi:hypothetical protein